MNTGIRYNSGDVVITTFPFVDSSKVKKRPALVLFEDENNVVAAGITSNLNHRGILLTEKDGMIKDSVIKLNYIFTLKKIFLEKKIAKLNVKKKRTVYDGLNKKLKGFLI